MPQGVPAARSYRNDPTNRTPFGNRTDYGQMTAVPGSTGSANMATKWIIATESGSSGCTGPIPHLEVAGPDFFGDVRVQLELV
jgi:hypothetical protein